MKKNSLIFLYVMLIAAIPVSSQVTMGSLKAPEKFSLLELISNSRLGLRLPQLTALERTALEQSTDFQNQKTGLAKGLVIFNTDTKCMEVWNGKVWISECASQTNVCFETSTKGTDFWVSFGNNFNSSNPLLALKISAEESTDVTLNFTHDGSATTYPVGNNSLVTIDLSSVQNLGDKRNAVYLNSNTAGAYDNSLHITSIKPVSVYAFNTNSATSDATVVMPADAWGNDYYRLSYEAVAGFYDFEIIIANQDNTSIFLNPIPIPAAVLNKGQVFVNTVLSDDMTGRHITSDKPVAYFTHSTIAKIPTGRDYGDILFEQMMPVNRWGKRFLVPNAPEGANDKNNHIRIIASEAGTTVNFIGAKVVTGDANNVPIPNETIINSGEKLNAGQWVELEINGSNNASCYIFADKPIGVAAYMVGSKNTDLPNGDPSIAWIPPLNQSIQSSIIAPFMFPFGVPNSQTNFDGLYSTSNDKSGNVFHYMIIIAPTDKKDQTAVNGTAIPSAGWIENQESGYSYYYWNFDNIADLNNIFKITNSDGVIVLCGGVTQVESYYYNAGSGTCIINTD